MITYAENDASLKSDIFPSCDKIVIEIVKDKEEEIYHEETKRYVGMSAGIYYENQREEFCNKLNDLIIFYYKKPIPGLENIIFNELMKTESWFKKWK